MCPQAQTKHQWYLVDKNAICRKNVCGDQMLWEFQHMNCCKEWIKFHSMKFLNILPSVVLKIKYDMIIKEIMKFKSVVSINFCD